MSNKWRDFRGRGAYGDGFAGDIYDALGGGAWSDEQATGNGPTEMDMMNWAYDEYSRNQQNQWQQNMYMEDRAWQEEMYERYQSIGGQIDQMRQNGLNPALMYQGAGTPPAVQSAQMPSSGSGSSPNGGSPTPPNGLQQAMSVVQSILGFANVASALGTNISQIKRNAAQNDVSKAQAELLRSQKEGVDYDNEVKRIDSEGYQAIYDLNKRLLEADVTITEAKAFFAKTNEELQSKLNEKNLEKIKKEINLLDAESALKEKLGNEADARAALAIAQATLTNLDVDKARILNKYAEKYRIAEINMMNAKTYAERQTAQEAWARTQKELQDYAIKEELIDKGLVDETFKQMQLDTKRKKRENGAILMHTICEGVSTACQVVGTAVTAGVGGSLSKSGPAPEFSSNPNDYYSIL